MKKKKITILSTRTNDIDNLRKLTTYIGKKVFSKHGNDLGKIKEVFTKQDNFAGFLVKGKRKLFVDREYLDSESEKAIILTMDPVTENIGKIVFDGEGKKLGKVVGINRNTNANTFETLSVKKNIFSKPIPVKREDIETAKENIILNKAY